MKRISWSAANGVAAFFLIAHAFLAIPILIMPALLFADPPHAVRQPHPLAWIHSLPTGEIPGWSEPNWLNLEASTANIWNAPMVMNDLKTGKQYQYSADYEQNSAFLEIGHAFFDRLGIALEVPYADRIGGILDHTIDAFHLLIGNRRFNREYYPKYQETFSVKTDGVEYFDSGNTGDGISNINLKLKFWFLKWLGESEGSCPCGLSIGTQTKLPIGKPKEGGTTGDIDQSIMLNFGIPLFSSSAIWGTAGYTFLGDNPAMKDWPRFKQITFYDLNLSFGLGENFGLLLYARAESPFLNSEQLQYYDTSLNPEIVARNRAASGWNSLVRWRGTESIGIYYRTMGGSQYQLQMVEDWGIGPYDASDDVYSNGAPDVNFVLHTNITW